MAANEIANHARPGPISVENLDDYLAEQHEVADVVAMNPKVAGVMFERYLWAAAISNLLDRPRDVTRSCLELSFETGVAAFQLAQAPRPITVVIAGRNLELRNTGVTDATHPPAWLRLFGLALTLRRTSACDLLSAFDVDILRRSTAVVDEYRFEVVKAIQAFWRDQDWRGLADRARELARPEHLRVSDRANVEVDLGQLALLEPLERRDSDAFNEALFAALEAHRRLWSDKRWAGDVTGWIAITQLGLAALARDRGLEVRLTSGYMPDWLLVGDKA